MDGIKPQPGFLANGGAMGERILCHDWSATPIGAIGTWPQYLRTAVGMMLSSKLPTFMVWGPELTAFYNDAYKPILGAKPEALGRPFREIWSEAWGCLGAYRATGPLRGGPLLRGSAAYPLAQRVSGADVVDLLLQPDPR
jgi:hypothetical protein